MAAIEIGGLTKTYSVGFWRKRPKVALLPLNLTVEQGEVFGFLGPNGAGKSTTLKLLMGLVYPTAGSARILGMALDDPRMKARIGFLPEQPYFYDYLTGSELLHYYAQLSGVPSGERAGLVRDMLERVGLADAAKVQLRKFSKGMLQRVGIAQAILHRPEVVFLDEPMSGLDPLGRREVRLLIEQLKREGRTVFFSTHILSDAETLCDRVAVIHKGELRGVGAISDLTARVEGKIEITLRGTQAPTFFKTIGAQSYVAGDSVRAVIPEQHQDAALEAIRMEGKQIVSLNPVHGSLEEYYLQKLNVKEPAPAVAVARA